MTYSSICDAIEEGVTVADSERKSKAAMDDVVLTRDRGGDASKQLQSS